MRYNLLIEEGVATILSTITQDISNIVIPVPNLISQANDIKVSE